MVHLDLCGRGPELVFTLHGLRLKLLGALELSHGGVIHWGVDAAPAVDFESSADLNAGLHLGTQAMHVAVCELIKLLLHVAVQKRQLYKLLVAVQTTAEGLQDESPFFSTKIDYKRCLLLN